MADDLTSLAGEPGPEARWIKSSLSGANGNCVEARQWAKASESNFSGNCVQVAAAPGVELRDSKNPDGPVLAFTRAEFAAFIGGVRLGEFDELAGLSP